MKNKLASLLAKCYILHNLVFCVHQTGSNSNLSGLCQRSEIMVMVAHALWFDI